jgi:hypothetical protein
MVWVERLKTEEEPQMVFNLCYCLSDLILILINMNIALRGKLKENVHWYEDTLRKCTYRLLVAKPAKIML